MVCFFTKDIGMQFGVNKCSIMVLKSWKLENLNNDIIFEMQDTIKSLDKNNCYKYISILEVGNIKHQQIISQNN